MSGFQHSNINAVGHGNHALQITSLDSAGHSLDGLMGQMLCDLIEVLIAMLDNSSLLSYLLTR